MYDDIYPHPASGFRIEEFTYLLNNISNSKAILSGEAYKAFKLPAKQHEGHINNLIASKLVTTKQIEQTPGIININCKLFYCVFLNNIFKHLHWIEKYEIPFAFTLYPGGGFAVSEDETENKLRKILSSPCFKKVIVTQRKTLNYLVENSFCTKDKILFVFGVVVPQVSLSGNTPQKKFYGTSKQSFDICFCASKYTKFGEDKGYPLFVEFIKLMAIKYDFLKFHVVGGGFDKNVLDVSTIEDRIEFYGQLDFDNLQLIFRNVDLIMSPNQPDKLNKGSFDGFPLGTVIEAAFNEVVVMLTDNFKENVYFEDGEELIIIEPSLNDMVSKFEPLLTNIDAFYEIGKRGKEKFRQIYSNDYQMGPRTALLKSLIQAN